MEKKFVALPCNVLLGNFGYWLWHAPPTQTLLNTKCTPSRQRSPSRTLLPAKLQKLLRIGLRTRKQDEGVDPIPIPSSINGSCWEKTDPSGHHPATHRTHRICLIHSGALLNLACSGLFQQVLDYWVIFVVTSLLALPYVLFAVLAQTYYVGGAQSSPRIRFCCGIHHPKTKHTLLVYASS